MATETTSSCAGGARPRVRRIGAVSFLNSRPLIHGLDQRDDVEITFAVPSRLTALLDAGQVDVALVPVVDMLAEGRRWAVISDACIGCDGQTLTVRVFSRTPPDQVRRLWADPASHTSVALARLIWREMYDSHLDVQPLNGSAEAEECDAVLLIGDKVVASAPYGFTYQVDLGGAWKTLTGLPFVFAVWAADEKADLGDCAQRLSEARDRGVASASALAERHGPEMGWPLAMARDYLTRYLTFTLDSRHRDGMTRFLALAGSHKIVPPHRELIFA